MSGNEIDKRFMAEALALAKKGWGKTSINPLVGAVVVKENKIIGRGFHRKIGEAHAEVIALIEAGSKAKGATLYVNLEPCTFRGRTPPCVGAIINAGIKRVIIGMEDPNPLVKGNGIKILNENNINTTVGINGKEANELNRFYTKYISTKIPYIILKIAVSQDGRISNFPQKYITCEASRRFVHSLRSQVDGIMVGINTVLKDNPFLTDRLVGRNNPARIVIDPHLRIPMTANFLKENARRIIITSETDNVKKIKSLQDAGVEIINLSGDYYPIGTVFETIGRYNIGSVLVEGGGILFSQIYSKKIYDELYIFVAPQKIGTGIDFIAENNIELSAMEELKIGEDRLYVHRNR